MHSLHCKQAVSLQLRDDKVAMILSASHFSRFTAVAASVYFVPSICAEISPVKPCSDLQAPTVENATVTKFTATEASTSYGKLVCNANTYITHGDAADSVRVQTYLPLSGYTGRFQGLGGGGMVAGSFGEYLAGPAAEGFAVGSTDAGRPNATISDDTWAGDDQLLRNFAYLSIHEMTVVSKALAEQFYGQPVEYAYYQGCSNGGRQGYEEVQRYPNDYHGVLANAPGILWDRFLVADLYPYLVETSYGQFPPTCIWDAITAAAVDACDGLDGGLDKIVNNPFRCDFDASTTIGRIACNNTINSTHADMWNIITRGPHDPNGNRVWGGLIPGTNFTQLGGSKPFSIARAWTSAFVEGNRSFNVGTIHQEDLYLTVLKSETMFGDIIGADKANISAFRDAGGKLLTWHGLVDQLIPPFGTIKYRESVESLLGGNSEVNKFYRLFLAPGVDHCAGGSGAVPTNPLSLLVDWVETGKVPEAMPAQGTVGERNLCPYPQEAVYNGCGNLSLADSWTCIP